MLSSAVKYRGKYLQYTRNLETQLPGSFGVIPEESHSKFLRSSSHCQSRHIPCDAFHRFLLSKQKIWVAVGDRTSVCVRACWVFFFLLFSQHLHPRCLFTQNLCSESVCWVYVWSRLLDWRCDRPLWSDRRGRGGAQQHWVRLARRWRSKSADRYHEVTHILLGTRNWLILTPESDWAVNLYRLRWKCGVV